MHDKDLSNNMLCLKVVFPLLKYQKKLNSIERVINKGLGICLSG